jgi:hypothetical protein
MVAASRSRPAKRDLAPSDSSIMVSRCSKFSSAFRASFSSRRRSMAALGRTIGAGAAHGAWAVYRGPQCEHSSWVCGVQGAGGKRDRGAGGGCGGEGSQSQPGLGFPPPLPTATHFSLRMVCAVDCVMASSTRSNRMRAAMISGGANMAAPPKLPVFFVRSMKSQITAQVFILVVVKGEGSGLGDRGALRERPRYGATLFRR